MLDPTFWMGACFGAVGLLALVALMLAIYMFGFLCGWWGSWPNI